MFRSLKKFLFPINSVPKQMKNVFKIFTIVGYSLANFKWYPDP